MRSRKISFYFLLIFSFCAMISNSAQAATIKGVIKYEGTPPEVKAINMDGDPICLTNRTEPVYPESIVLGDGQTLANVFVHVVAGLPQKTYPVPTAEAIIDQKGCMYDPHVLGVMVGQPIKILNPDGTLHNVHVEAKVNESFNLAMPKFRKEVIKTFFKPEFMLSVKCDVHPWMNAYIAVMTHPYFSVTKKDGEFAIVDLPAGQYEVEAWHEKLGTKKTSVTLNSDETKEITFSFPKL